MQARRETLYELFDRARSRGTDPAAGAPFDPAASPWHGRAIFLVGAPRSGTTWLHQLLATHPAVATGGEAHLFCEGMGQLLDNHADPDRYMKLSTWVTRPELLGLMRALADQVFTLLRDATRPDATHVVDKTPNHDPHAAKLAAVYPDGIYVHIVRDARDAVASARDLWSFDPGWRSARSAARRWRDAVADVRQHLGGLRAFEIRYEDLVEDTPRHLAAILDHCGLEHDPDYVGEAVAFSRAPINVRPSEVRVGVRKWEGTDPDAERQVVAVAGALLEELGYLDGGERAAILARRSWRRTGEEVADVAGDLARRAAALVREQRGPRDNATVKRTAQALAEAVIAARHADVVALLSEDVVLLHGAGTDRGPTAVADRLLALGAGRTLAALDADPRAAAIRYTGDDGSNQLHATFVDRAGTVHRIEVQGA